MNKLKDVENGRYVLISSHFWYFGRDAIKLPTDLRYTASVGRGHRSKFERSLLKTFGEFISRQNNGVHAPPAIWPDDDISRMPYGSTLQPEYFAMSFHKMVEIQPQDG